MKCILKYVCILFILLIITSLAACTNNTSSTTTSTTTTTTSTIPPTPLPTVAPPDTKFYDMPDSGIIEIEGQNFYYQRVYAFDFSGPSLYRNVVFNDKDRGTVTYTGISGWYTATFSDGIEEDLLFAGTLISPSWYQLTNHISPQAGIYMVKEDHDWVMYALVSVD